MANDSTEPNDDDLRNVAMGDLGELPADAAGPNDWRIELRYLPVAHRAHAFLSLVDRSNNVQRELHGLSRSRNTNELIAMGSDGSNLVAVQPKSDRHFRGRTIPISTVYSGSYDDVIDKWRSGLQAAIEMNQKNLDYKADDITYELGGSGGEIQNSNSANYSIGKAMHLDLASEIRGRGLERKFPGFGRDILDPAYKPYVTPQFPPNENRP